jgi:NTE family protein
MSPSSSEALRATTRAKYLPSEGRSGSALCLSGGGYRAALFHLGACRRLNELGVLAGLDVVSAVSGGSIFAAHLAQCIFTTKGACFADYEGVIAVPFREFVTHDIRTGPALTRLLPWEWWNAGAGADALAAQYDKLLVKGMLLGDLPPKPRFVFCATDLTFGVDWVFSRDKVGDYQAGYMTAADTAAQPVARAVAASSCFPPVFRPLPMHLRSSDLKGGDATGDDRDDCVRQLVLTDGGVYDNMGLEPVWKTCKTVLVSDGGKPFRLAKEHDTPHQLYRMQDVMANQAEALRKRWLISGYLRGDYQGAYFGIQNSVSEYPAENALGYSKELAAGVLAKIRTDMDRFSADEIAVLENHGYTLADAACKSHLCPSGGAVPPMKALENRWWPVSMPLPVQTENGLRAALADSGSVHIFGH